MMSKNEAEHTHQHQINEVTYDDDKGRAKNNNCWKCGGTSHFARECLLNTTEGNQPKPNPVAANAEINIPWTLPIRQNQMADMMKKAINSEVRRRSAQAKYKRLKNRVQQLTTAVTSPTTTKQKTTVAKATTTKTPSTPSTRAVTTAGKTITKTTKATTSMASSVPQVVIRTKPAAPSRPKTSKTATSYTGPITRARAKKQAQVHLLETIPENSFQ